jgi:hypothetical protein
MLMSQYFQILFFHNLSSCIKLLLIGFALPLSHVALAKCLSPPVGENLARGCYVESTVWKGSRASVALWQPEKSWRGDWQAGDENKDSAVLVFSSEGKPRLINQWCKESCFAPGSADLRLTLLELTGRLVLWLPDPPRGSRHGPIGDVISVDTRTGMHEVLAKNQNLLQNGKGEMSREVVVISSCPYWLSDAWLAVTPEKTVVPSGYLLIAHPQPISLRSGCPDLAVEEPTKAVDLQRLVKVLGAERMRKANQYLRYGEWRIKQGNLEWLNDEGKAEKLE